MFGVSLGSRIHGRWTSGTPTSHQASLVSSYRDGVAIEDDGRTVISFRPLNGRFQLCQRINLAGAGTHRLRVSDKINMKRLLHPAIFQQVIKTMRRPWRFAGG
ncbi:Uncharacterised protein [Raoultella planticola]|uniref:Uncharacterized protein n=1 Tax=Raoultella planticola TaxID=575 RepID=A0A485AV51_RAOPL|nr:Uncharacterised protein [Raoultella planticola]